MPYNIHEQKREPNLPSIPNARGISTETHQQNHIDLEILFHRERRKKGIKIKLYKYKTNETYFDQQKRIHGNMS